ncbi:ArsJ-associated glyceraldehyde-3-phosphate dehydrogenase [Rhodobacter sphaeroides]|jgi:glyceraldehyde-3-phosphate dehydrogenase (EC 1.2.1.12)|uniref:Glyceraldehyde-3-phosphate dehydrogenase n=1 Tax=Cereibacter sphaeroides (strain ATCC 17023 / DSM 158 / JCM 6121 / CCUG 31486 / LMG 2827 / NBRC 12203 / NCIMB 8253 / ATH 2.4.1.) TaxID=272943 RepID=Q3IUX5_CERS4|nr:ArsJ-associated glyceraldehyde-3-phosphate dehydrogenase [Cereibacter sphaeroides]ABA81659.1 Glyceraldehyde-3-phosphate dehydrogenase, type I [Cereibacter sphaeroides 2.4.1]AMJ49803.1 glyceraldehyde-3-phosphate dehydrogenase [Cereibacter sphaeroides]ANS36562.1 glyceraldehyde-3-phosphate dehydrogenase [Cereibacter sphaeroides]ATN65574.1 glyceraldehyde-3-phosphate dehydrogenase [Cereibacter sphaeroides]AXC64183.1 type I glyceraldehyde-3-phosphate dehydrogenase [Cereibacter sphaeroides 2.4.1]
MARIAINGLGRMGKLLLRELIDRGMGDGIMLLNDAEGDPAQHALLMEFDSVHGRWTTPVTHDAESLTLAGHRIPLRRERRIEDLPLGELGVDLVVDCTGVFKTAAKIAPYFEAVKKVVVSAPVKDGGALNLVYGINHQLYDGSQRLVTAASCTTNCLAPVVKVIHERLGIRHGSITTIHDVTNTQTIVDRPAKNMRRARSALANLIPTSTGSATAIGLIYPELKGRLNGHAVRVPLLNASLTDCVFEVERPTTAEEVNALFAEAAAGPLKGILGYEERPLVSSDFLNDPRSAVVDAASTMVVGGTQVKIYAWYDNEWGYACRMADITRLVAESLT